LMAQLTKPLRIGGKFAIKHYSSQLTWLSHKSSYLRRAMKNAELTMRCAPNAEELGTFRQDVTYVTRKAEYMFGMRPKVGVQEGLAMTVAWLEHMGEAV